MRPLERWLPWLVGAVLVVPLLVARYPPMTDLPLFEGALALLRHWGDPAFVPPDVYQLNLGRTTQLAFALGLPLAYLMSTAWACKVLVSACVVAMVVGTARLARHVGASPWVAPLAAPVALGWIVFIGFVAYLVGTAIWVLALPLLDRWVEKPTVRRGAAACGMVILLHFAHLASSACAVIAIVVLTAARGLDRFAPVRLVPAALALALAAADRHADRGLAAGGALAWEQRGMVWPPLHIKFTMAGDYLFGAVGALPELLVVALVGVVALAAARVPPAAPQRGPSQERPRVRWRFAMLAGSLLLAYAVSPWAVGGGAYFDGRFLAPAWLVGIAALGQRAPNPLPALARAVAACIPLAWLAVVWPAFADSDREQRALADLYPHVQPASAVATLAVADDGGQPYLRASAGNRVLSERGGRALYTLSEAPRAPVLVARRTRWDEAVSRIYNYGTDAICLPFDATRFHYLLLRIPDDDLVRAIAMGLAPDYRVEAASGAWVLFVSTHVTVPLDAPDAAPPANCDFLKRRVAVRSGSSP
jgi:hypothetical protein